MRRVGALVLVGAALVIAFLAATRHGEGPDRAARGCDAPTSPHETDEERIAHGAVLDADTGAPVAGARVTLYRVSQWLPEPQPVRTVVTDDSGEFPVSLEKDCRYLAVEAEGYPLQAGWLDPEGTEIRLERGTDHTFEIVDDEGRPAARAEVGAYANWGLCLASVEADARGFATVRYAGNVGLLLVRYPGCADEDVGGSESRVVLSTGFAIGGQVVDSGGEPIAGASVRLRQGTTCKPVSDHEPMLLTGANGRFLFHGIHECVCEMTVRAEGFWDVGGYAVPGDEKVQVVLLRAASVSGTVVLPDGSPAPGARVCPDSPEWTTGRREALHVDADGRFRIDSVEPRTQLVYAGADPDLTGSAQVTPPEGGTATDVRIVLGPRAHSCVRIRVTDERGQAVPGVKVIRHFWRALATTDTEGMATVTLDEPETDLTLHLVPDKERSPNLCEAAIETRSFPSPASAQVVEVALHESVYVGLDARAPDGAQVAEAKAAFIGGAAARDSEKGYGIDPAATYGVRVWAPGFLNTEIKEWRFATTGTPIVVTLRPCVAVRGRVVDTFGAPLQSIRVAVDAVFNVDGETWRWVPCQADGSFLLDGLGEGSGQLVVCRENYGIPEAGAAITTVSGKTTDVGTLRLVPPVILEGKVVDAVGRPVGGALLRMVGVTEFWGATYSHADGRFRFAVPAFATGDVLVGKHGLGTVRQAVTPGPSRSIGDIALPPAGSIEIQADGIDWKRCDYVELDVAWPGGPMAESTLYWQHDPRPYRIDDLAPGRYIVRVSAGPLSMQAEIEVTAGQITPVTFGLRD